MRRRIAIRFTGMVQGVGFRYTTRHLAAGFPGIAGTVRNLPDGSVEVIAQGEDPDLTSFADSIEERMGGYIREAKRTYLRATDDLTAFRIVH